MRIFIAAIGSGGDLNPMLGIALCLKRGGHEVTVLAGSWQEPPVRRLGLRFQSILSEESFERFTQSVRANAENGADWLAFFHHAVFPAMRSVVDYLSTKVTPADTLLVGSSHAIGLKLVAEKFGVPLVTTRLQPQPRPTEDLSGRDHFNRLLTPHVDRYRKSIGLPPIPAPFDTWLASQQQDVALFPSWFVDERVDAPVQGRMTDFVFFEQSGAAGTDPRTDAFLATWEQPIVFTHGTGNNMVREFFETSLIACRRLRKPAIFVTKFTDQLPVHSCPWILHASYLPFDRVLPYVGAIAYHGGIGTCAQALRAGIPQLVIPAGFDQFQNAARVECLLAGLQMRRRDYTPDQLCGQLEKLTSTAAIAQRCKWYASRFGDLDPIGRICDAVTQSATAAAVSPCNRAIA